MNEPLEIKFLGNDVIEVDGIKITLELIKSAMNPTVFAERTLFSVKRVDDLLQFTSYYNATESQKFFEQFANENR